MKISLFIFLGFVVILVMFSITTYINFRLADQVNENQDWLAQSTTVVRNGNRFQRNILNMVSGLRGYLFTGEENFIQAYDSAYAENENLLKELKSVITDQAGPQMTILAKVEEINRDWVINFAIPLIEAKKFTAGPESTQEPFNLLYRNKVDSGYETRTVNALNSYLRNLINYEYAIREGRKAELDKSIQKTRALSIYLTSFSIITGLVIAAFLAVSISRRIVRMANMADTIASGNYDTHIEDKGKDELSQLASSLNHMAKVLAENFRLLQRKNKELDQFAHIISHDMKAPLRGIDNVVTWIEEDHVQELSSKVKEYIGLIKTRIVRGENLIRGILSYSRVGQYEMNPEQVDVNILLQELAETVTLRPGLRLEIEKGMPVLFTLRVPLFQVFANLIENANKYHDKADGYIKVYHTSDSMQHTFYVEDNGPGIAQHYHNKIFVIFQTLNGSDSFQSTGVGLAIVKKILDDQHQNITLTSEEGKGSIFAFTWPKNLDQG